MKVELLSLDHTPVVSPNHPDALEVRFGFEGGTVHKVDGTYYLFTTEVFDEPKTAATRLALWTSADGQSFTRARVIATTNGDWSDSTYRMSPWSPMAVFDAAEEKWNLFHVSYRRKAGSSQPFNMAGKIARRVSLSDGLGGVSGPYGEPEWVTFTGPADDWEGLSEIVSFMPHQTDEGWFAFYGSNEVPEYIDLQSHPQHATSPDSARFRVGLAVAESLEGPWRRLSEKNPVLLDPDFVENPIVTRVHDSLYVVVYDGGNTHSISYATSVDGVDWNAEQQLVLHDVPDWLSAVRTPLGLVHEGGDRYSLYFTAFDGLNPDRIEPLWHDGFGYIGRCLVRIGAS